MGAIRDTTKSVLVHTTEDGMEFEDLTEAIFHDTKLEVTKLCEAHLTRAHVEQSWVVDFIMAHRDRLRAYLNDLALHEGKE